MTGDRWGEYEILAREPAAGDGFDAVARLGDRTYWLWAGAAGRGSAEEASELAARLARVYQANLPRVLGSDFVEGRVVLRLAPVEGERLTKRLARDRIDPPAAIDVAQSLGAALVKLHRAGFVHGAIDVSEAYCAANGTVYLLHGGLGPFLGSRPAQSPDDVAGAPRDEASDVFGLARLLHALVEGTDPWPGDAVREEGLRADLPQGFRRFLARALTRDTGRRIRRADEFTADARVIRASWGSGSEPASGPRRFGVRPLLVAGTLVLGTVLALCARGCSDINA